MNLKNETTKNYCERLLRELDSAYKDTQFLRKSDQIETVKDYCERYRRELDSFYSSRCFLLGLGLVELDRLPIESNIYSKDGGDLYFEKLLPEFIEFTVNESFDIFKFDKRKDYEVFQKLLNKYMEQISSEPIVFNGCVYFIRCEYKEIGLPKDIKLREEFFEFKELFYYKYYKVSEKGFFETIIFYINLYEKMKKEDREIKSRYFYRDLIIMSWFFCFPTLYFFAFIGMGLSNIIAQWMTGILWVSSGFVVLKIFHFLNDCNHFER